MREPTNPLWDLMTPPEISGTEITRHCKLNKWNPTTLKVEQCKWKSVQTVGSMPTSGLINHMRRHHYQEYKERMGEAALPPFGTPALSKG